MPEQWTDSEQKQIVDNNKRLKAARASTKRAAARVQKRPWPW